MHKKQKQRYTRWVGAALLLSLISIPVSAQQEVDYLSFARGALPQTVVELTYELPALTTFDSFAVSNIFETPSPSQTFFKNVVVLGSASGPEGTQTGCSENKEVTLGCGSIVYGIHLNFDSAEIKTDSAQLLQELYQGLADSPATSILIKGHTSSGGLRATTSGFQSGAHML